MLKLFGVRLNVRTEAGSFLLAGVVLVTTVSLVLVLFKMPQLDNRSGWDGRQWEKQEPGMHRSLEEFKRALDATQEHRTATEVHKVERSEEYRELNGILEKPVTVLSSPSSSYSSIIGNRTGDISGGSNQACAEWVSRVPKAPYFLTVVMNVRIYETDKAKLTTKELKAWLQYLRYAGVEHVYLYDAWLHKNESQLAPLRVFIDEGYITYTDWHTHNPYSTKNTSVAAYQDCIDRRKGENTWQVAIDLDEFPFSPTDTAPGFLYRFVQQLSKHNPRVSEISMQNYLYLGKPLDKDLLIERLLRRTPDASNRLVKPIYKPSNVRADIHHNRLKRGRLMVAPDKELRLNHYWGTRLQNWGEDTPEILGKTEHDNSILPIVDAFKNCEDDLRPYLR